MSIEKKINVVVVVPSLEEKGPIIVSNNIILSLLDKVDFTIVSLRVNDKSKKDLLVHKGISVYEIKMGKIPTLSSFKRIRALIKKIKPDIIHTHSFWPTVLISYIDVKSKKVTTLHNNPKEDFSYEYGGLVGNLMTNLFIHSLQKFHRCVAISEYVKYKHEYLGLTCPIEVIYNGIEDAFTVSENFNNDHMLKIISISVLNERKNLKRSIDIVNVLNEKGYSINYKIIGDGPEKNNLLKQINESNLKHENILVGSLPRKEVLEYIKNSDVLLFTSKSEGLGLVVLECLMMGKVVVCSNLDVFNEFISDGVNGYICNDDEDYLKVFDGLVNNSEQLNKLRTAARETYINLFKIEDMSSAYFKLYKGMRT